MVGKDVVQQQRLAYSAELQINRTLVATLRLKLEKHECSKRRELMDSSESGS